MANFAQIIEQIIKSEGGYQNMPTDTGNYSCGELAGTKYGISAIGLEAYLGRCILASDVLALTKDDAKTIYRNNYWDKIRGDEIESYSVAYIIMDHYIMNPTTATKLVENVLKKFGINTNVNNQFSQAVISDINKCEAKDFFLAYKEERRLAFEKLRSSKPEFMDGWLNRLNKFTFDDWKMPLRNYLLFAGVGAIIIIVFFQLLPFKPKR